MCITTDGGKYSCHPDGKRGMTIREFAALQGFPHHHEFFGREIRKQIGNAVPPMCAKVWFSHLRKHLERTDATEQAAREHRAIHIGD
jgi:DNA (cytosine-5)-methyltransferase 1